MPGNAFTASDKAVTIKLKLQQPEAQKMVMHQMTILLHFFTLHELSTYIF